MERYREHAPPATLRPFVRMFWTYAADAPSREVQRIAPDGCPELIFDIGAPYEEADAAGVFRTQPRVLFAGQMTRPMALRAVGPAEIVAARFEPDGARAFLGRPLVEATDRRLDMTGRLAGFSAPPGDPDRQVDALAAWLEARRTAEVWRLDPAVREEVDRIAAGLTGPARPGAERRALQRRFRDRVGVAPRTLRSIVRFREVFDRAARPDGGFGGWLEAGLDAGYFDQPQLARDFRRFLGCTAGEWARDQLELARHIASQSYKPDPAPPA